MLAWLLIITVNQGISPTDVPLPLWYAFGLALVAWLVGRAFHGQSIKTLIVASFAPMIMCFLVLLRISPSAYYREIVSGPFDFAWLGYALRDLLGGAEQTPNSYKLLLLVAYVWWRGLCNGAGYLTYEKVSRHFRWSLVAMLFVIVGIIAAPTALRGQTAGIFSLLLPAEVFFGLLSLALARISLQREIPGIDPTFTAAESSWLGSAVLLAGMVVLVAFFLNLIIDFQALDALLVNLGPAGRALDAAGRAITNAIAQLLYHLLNGLISSIAGKGHFSAPPPPHAQVCPPNSSTYCQNHPQLTPAQITPFWAMLTQILLQIVALVLIVGSILFILRQILVHKRPAAGTASEEEERESLDARSLFGAQLRALFQRQRQSRIADPLTPGTIRYLYRDVLRAAAQRGIERAPTETPEEYAQRLSQTASTVVNAAGGGTDLPLLSDAYVAARYGERDPSPAELPVLRERAARLVAQMTGHGQRRKR